MKLNHYKYLKKIIISLWNYFQDNYKKAKKYFEKFPLLLKTRSRGNNNYPSNCSELVFIM